MQIEKLQGYKRIQRTQRKYKVLPAVFGGDVHLPGFSSLVALSRSGASCSYAERPRGWLSRRLQHVDGAWVQLVWFEYT